MLEEKDDVIVQCCPSFHNQFDSKRFLLKKFQLSMFHFEFSLTWLLQPVCQGYDKG